MKTSTKKSAAKTSSKRASVKSAKRTSIKTDASTFGLPMKTWIESTRKLKGSEARSGSRGFLFLTTTREPKRMKTLASGHLSKWQLEQFLKSESDLVSYQGSQGPVWFVRVASPSNSEAAHGSAGALEKSNYAKFRDLSGSILSQASSHKVEKLIVESADLSSEELQGVLVGLELASYSFAENRDNPKRPQKKLPQILLKSDEDFSAEDLKSAANLALSINVARHLVNLPPVTLNPTTYSHYVRRLFAGSLTSKVDVWSGDRLVDENMNLMLAVGGAATEGPALVHIRYRPRFKSDARPIAIVGKGITFDTGGLDLKPSSAMRWMKKDMGGSAAALAIAYWAEATQYELPLDIYLALAENAVGSNSFRPGDIITARNGLTIEIHNTDAEGRLVLADALDVAVTQQGADKPQMVIDLATLTGAIKVGLGSDIAGLFCNNDDLADMLEQCGLAKGDLSWRMPLFQAYKPLFRSTFADHANASDGFGGAITAALFLELFVKDVAWAHLDIYAWKDGVGGAFAESGGNGQPVQAMTEFLARFSQNHRALGADS